MLTRFFSKYLTDRTSPAVFQTHRLEIRALKQRPAHLRTYDSGPGHDSTRTCTSVAASEGEEERKRPKPNNPLKRKTSKLFSGKMKSKHLNTDTDTPTRTKMCDNTGLLFLPRALDTLGNVVHDGEVAVENTLLQTV